MRNSGVIWGALLIGLGVLFLLRSLGLLPVAVGTLFWPLAIILFGVWLLMGAFGGRGRVESENLALQLKGFEEADVRVVYGAGRLTVDGGAAPDELLHGTFGGGVDHRTGEDGEVARIELRTPSSGWWDWGSPRDRDWIINLNNAIPIRLDLETGAGETLANLAKTRVQRLVVHTGASNTDITLPAAGGETTVEVEGGAAKVTLRVPEGVAARIEGGAALGALTVDTARFPRAGGAWQSDDYDTAANRVTIRGRIGAGEIVVQ